MPILLAGYHVKNLCVQCTQHKWTQAVLRTTATLCKTTLKMLGQLRETKAVQLRSEGGVMLMQHTLWQHT